MGQVLSNDGKLLLDHGVVRLDLLLGSKSLLDVAVQESEGELGVGRVGGADGQPQEVREDGDDVVPVDDEDRVDEVEGLGNGEVVQGDGLVGLDLLQSGGNGRRDAQLQRRAQLRDDVNDLEEGRDDESGENDCWGTAGGLRVWGRRREGKSGSGRNAFFRTGRAQIGAMRAPFDEEQGYKTNAREGQ